MKRLTYWALAAALILAFILVILNTSRTERNLEKCLAMLKEDDVEAQQSARDEIRRNADAILPVLSRMLNRNDSAIRKELYGTLVSTTGNRVRLRTARDGHRLALSACEVLGPVAGSLAPDVARHLPTLTLSKRSARALAAMGNPGYTQLVRSGLTHTSKLARLYSLEAIYENHPTIDKTGTLGVSDLLPILHDPFSLNRHYAIELLGMGQYAPELAVPALRRALEHGDPNDKASAAWALGEFGSAAEPALADLVSLSSHSDTDVAIAAREAVQKIEQAKAEKDIPQPHADSPADPR